MHEEIKAAVSNSQRAQRNYDLTKSISENDLETLIHAATNSPSKQNETHYSLHVYTDQTMIRKIYDHTKKFTLMSPKENLKELFGVDENGKYWQDDNQAVKNSQIFANALFVYVKEEGAARGGTHMAGQEHKGSSARTLYDEQINYSIGISIGELILTANLLGYRTGLCSAMDDDAIKKLLGVDNRVKMLVGVGYPNLDVDRRLHAETLNRDVPERFRSGEEEELWRFPSFEKAVKVKINGN